MDPVFWLIVIQTIILLFVAWFLASMIGRIMSLLDTVNEKVRDVEGELKPILRDVEQVLRNIEPLSKELGDKSREIGSMIENLDKVTDDAQATTNAIRHGVVPFAHSIAGIYTGLTEGAKILGEYSRKGKDQVR